MFETFNVNYTAYSMTANDAARFAGFMDDTSRLSENMLDPILSLPSTDSFVNTVLCSNHFNSLMLISFSFFKKNSMTANDAARFAGFMDDTSRLSEEVLDESSTEILGALGTITEQTAARNEIGMPVSFLKLAYILSIRNIRRISI